MVSFKEFKKSRKENSEFFSKIFSNKISPYFSFVFIRLGIKPNSITLLMIPSAIIGGILLNFGDFYSKLFGIIFILSINIWDTSDGEVARHTKVFSKNGKFLDLFSQFIADNIFFISCFLYFNKSILILFSCITYNIYVYTKRIQVEKLDFEQNKKKTLIKILKTIGSNNFLFHTFFLLFFLEDTDYQHLAFLLYWSTFAFIILLKIIYLFKKSYS
jgi:phosphatidylglycerophosphate synthase